MAVSASLHTDNKQPDASPKQESTHAVTATVQLLHLW